MREPTSPLEIVPGRVLAVAHQHLTVEFPPGQRPPTGTILTDGRALVEVLSPINLSEVRAALRRGLPPIVGTSLHTHAPGLRLPGPGALLGKGRVTPAGLRDGQPEALPQEGLALCPLPDDAQLPAQAQAPTGRLLSTGHPGIELLAPLFEGSSLAVVGEQPEGLMAWGHRHLPHLAREADLHILWVGGVPAPGLPPERLIHLADTPNQTGQRALLLRAAVTLADALTDEGHPLLVVIERPIDALVAWASVDARGAGPGPQAIEHLAWAVERLTRPQAPSRTVVGLFLDDPIRPAQLGPGAPPPSQTMTSVARLEGGALMLQAASSPWRDHLPPNAAALAESCMDILGAAEGLEDFAAIFGNFELDEEQLELLEIHRKLEAWLSGPVEEPASLKAVLGQGRALILGL